MKINIVLPYEKAAQMYHIWANEENFVDFRKEKERAIRCTVSYAAEELENYLKKLGIESYVSNKKNNDFNIILCISDNQNKDEFTFKTDDNSFIIDGNGRIGVLYGVYEFLEKQGIYWLNPWEEIIPTNTSDLIIPETKHYRASFPQGRGYYFEGQLKESEKLWRWMARKKLNNAGYRPWTHKLQQKLGIQFIDGGHIFEEILNPNKVLETGCTLWEEHEDWFGLPENKTRTKETAQSVGFCVSNTEVLEYVSKEIIIKLNEEWYDSDCLNIWGFDTWGGICSCEECRKIGNGADHTLHITSYIKDKIEKAYKDGILDRMVDIRFSAYEGTSDLIPPINSVPKNLINSNDHALFCPINRCYAHPLDDESCIYNKFYNQSLSNWKDASICVCEYYNVSKFEDLPFLFTKTMVKDFKHYHKLGVKGLVYMHLPMLHWDVKNLTQILFAELCWNIDTDAEEIINKYFKHRYGIHSDKIRKAYEMMEEAGKYCASLRAWNATSILSKLSWWTGRKPETPLEEDHLGLNVVEIGMESVAKYLAAIKIFEEELFKSEHSYILSITNNNEIKKAVNPDELIRHSKTDPLIERLRLDLNYANYGKDCMELITLMAKHYNSLYNDEEWQDNFNKIDMLCQKMMSYYIPLRYDNPAIDLYCEDALTRSQLKGLYYRCKNYVETELKIIN